MLSCKVLYIDQDMHSSLFFKKNLKSKKLRLEVALAD